MIDTEVSEQKLEDIPVVREFLDVFPKELPGYHQIERLSSLLIFYLVLAPFPRLLNYRMALTELKELKV